MVRKLLSLLMICFWALTVPLSFARTTTNFLEGPHDAIYLLAQPAENGEIKGGIYLELQKGWHTYWRNPGDAGEAPTIKAQLINRDGTNIDTADHFLEWESPQKFSEGGLTTYGFERRVFLPFKFHANEVNNKETAIIADVHWLVCEKVCIPRHAVLSLKLNNLSPSPYMPSFEQAFKGHLSRLPISAAAISPRFSMSSEKDISLFVPEVNSKSLKSAYFYANNTGIIAANDEQKLLTSSHNITLSMKVDETYQGRLEDLSGILALTYEGGKTQNISLDHIAVDKATTQKAIATATEPMGIASFLNLFVLAFAGGLILNLMPCVFPVLALKAFSVAKSGAKDKRKRISSALAYTAGVVGSFVCLGGLVIALRAGGQQIGWGFQFQSPIFILILCWFLLALSLNLLSVFDIQITIPGQNNAHTNGLKGDFLTGLLAVVVASPCTAPFMGTALAAALNAPAVLGLTLFASLGLGLAAPYLVLALSPKVAHCIPKPGTWMEVFKNCLAFPLLATCIWLAWVGTQQTGSLFVLWCLSGALFVAICLWLYGIFQEKALHTSSTKFRVLSWITLLVSLAPAAMTIYSNPLEVQKRETTEKKIEADTSSTYSAEKLAQLRRDGRAILIDMSADWCITCLVNEKTTFSTDTVKSYLKDHQITLMRGDWTNKDPAISTFLNSYKRDGVPLYVWFAAGLSADQKGKVLPQILTPSVLINEIKDQDTASQ